MLDGNVIVDTWYERFWDYSVNFIKDVLKKKMNISQSLTVLKRNKFPYGPAKNEKWMSFLVSAA